MTEPTTEAGRRFVDGSLSDMLNVYGEGWTKADVVVDIERQAREQAWSSDRLSAAIDSWYLVDGEKWRLVPMSEDGGLSITSPASWFAEAIIEAMKETADVG